jgi:cytochrome P450 family 103
VSSRQSNRVAGITDEAFFAGFETALSRYSDLIPSRKRGSGMSTYTPSSRVNESGIPIVPVSELRHNAHEIYRYFRGKMPFILSETGAYLVLRGDDVVSLYSDTKTRQVETELLSLRGINDGPIWDVMKIGMLTSNGDDHRRRRAPMTRTFAFKMIAALRPHIRQTITEIVDSFAAEGEMEILADFANHIPARIIASILDLPRQDIPRFTDMVYRLSPIFSAAYPAEDVPKLQRAAADLWQYVADLVKVRRLEAGDGFLSSYIAATDEGESLSPAEAIVQLMALIIGGTDTSRAALVIQLAVLLENPEQWRILVENPDLVPNAVLECLRYEPSVASVTRVATADIELDGLIMPANRVCTLSTMSALRDDVWYQDPDRLDITREQPKWHPVFGGGAHRCLGEALAKAELEESLAVLVERFPDIRAKGAYPKVLGYSGIRQVEPFPVILGRAS